MLSTALIGLREGLEASIIVVILVAFLVKTERRDALKWVWAGVASALVLSVAVGAALTYGTSTLTFRAQEAVGGFGSILAVALVTGMVLWMRTAARTMSGQLKGSLGDALVVGSKAVVLMSFLAVAREGLETALFFFSAVQSAGGGTAEPLLGFSIGIAVSVALGTGLYRGAVRIDLGKFFSVTGVLLIVVAAGILAYGVHDLQEAAILPGLNTLAFDVSGAVPPGSWYGTLLKGFFNFSPASTVLEVCVWVTYIVVVLALFLRPARRPTAATNAAATAAAHS